MVHADLSTPSNVLVRDGAVVAVVGLPKPAVMLFQRDSTPPMFVYWFCIIRRA